MALSNNLNSLSIYKEGLFLTAKVMKEVLGVVSPLGAGLLEALCSFDKLNSEAQLENEQAEIKQAIEELLQAKLEQESYQKAIRVIMRSNGIILPSLIAQEKRELLFAKPDDYGQRVQKPEHGKLNVLLPDSSLLAIDENTFFGLRMVSKEALEVAGMSEGEVTVLVTRSKIASLTNTMMNNSAPGEGWNQWRRSDVGPETDTNYPSVIGQYKILGILGHGGFGTVYHAESLAEPGVFRAIKVVNETMAKTIGAERLLKKEFEIAGQLRGVDGVVQVYRFDEGNETTSPHLVMEVVEGKSLKVILDEKGKLETAEIASIVSSIAGSLQQAHAKGIIHHDIKPGNVIVTADGKVKLTDFGVGELITSQEVQHTAMSTLAGNAGTFSYMSPERLRGEKGNEKSDVYSLGVLLGRMMGRDPMSRTKAKFDSYPKELVELYWGCVEDEVEKRLGSQELEKHIQSLEIAKVPQIDIQLSPERAAELEREIKEIEKGLTDEQKKDISYWAYYHARDLLIAATFSSLGQGILSKNANEILLRAIAKDIRDKLNQSPGLVIAIKSNFEKFAPKSLEKAHISVVHKNSKYRIIRVENAKHAQGYEDVMPSQEIIVENMKIILEHLRFMDIPDFPKKPQTTNPNTPKSVRSVQTPSENSEFKMPEYWYVILIALILSVGGYYGLRTPPYQVEIKEKLQNNEDLRKIFTNPQLDAIIKNIPQMDRETAWKWLEDQHLNREQMLGIRPFVEQLPLK